MADSSPSRARKPRYCDDWACDQKWSCRHHFVRSHDYWAMNVESEKEFFQGDRTRWGCFDYELDVPKGWLNEILGADAEVAPKILAFKKPRVRRREPHEA